MAKLVTTREILEQGYKLENGIYKKGKSRYLLCNCSRFNEIKVQPDSNGKILWKCIWCGNGNQTRIK